MTNLSEMTPKQIDTELASLHEASNTACLALHNAHATISSLSGWRAPSRRAILPTATDFDGTVAKARERVAGRRYREDSLDHAIASAARAVVRIAEVNEKIDIYNEEFTSRPWSRFFLVSGGHIHSRMSCSTCRPTTQFGWLPALSGKTEKDAVAAHGTRLCSVCFPSAPVEWRTLPKDEDVCAGSGNLANIPAHMLRRYGLPTVACETCGKKVSATRSGKIRKHKPA